MFWGIGLVFLVFAGTAFAWACCVAGARADVLERGRHPDPMHVAFGDWPAEPELLHVAEDIQ